jgi:hypothetical protein
MEAPVGKQEVPMFVFSDEQLGPEPSATAHIPLGGIHADYFDRGVSTDTRVFSLSRKCDPSGQSMASMSQPSVALYTAYSSRKAMI